MIDDKIWVSKSDQLHNFITFSTVISARSMNSDIIPNYDLLKRPVEF